MSIKDHFISTKNMVEVINCTGYFKLYRPELTLENDFFIHDK